MRARSGRLLAALLTLTVMLAAAAAVQRAEPQMHAFRVVLGVDDAAPTDWSGSITVNGGELVGLTGWRFESADKIEGTSWKCRTREYIAPEARYPITPPTGKPPAPPRRPWPNGVQCTVRGAEPTVSIKLAQGEVQFRAAELLLGEPKTFLGGKVRVERLPDTVVVRPESAPQAAHPVQDDYPAFWVRYRTGKQYLAWVAYQDGKDRVMLVERNGPNGAFSEPKTVADTAGDHFRVALASTHDDTLWIVWAAQAPQEKQWQLRGRSYQHGQFGAEVPLAAEAGPNVWHRMTTDQKGRAWLVWQGFRDGQSDIFARCCDDKWHEPIRVSTSPANDWDPCIAADSKEDRVWVGWDSYDTGSYGVRVRSLSGGPERPVLGDEQSPEKSPLFGAHLSLACDRDGRLWAAWDESGPQWGKDTGYQYSASPATRLYASRRVRVKCLADGKWQDPAALDGVLPVDMKEYNELPQLQEDPAGRMWLAFRHRTCRRPRADGWAIQARWNVYATADLGDRWLPPVELDRSAGRDDMRISSQRDTEGNVYFAYASDNRQWQLPGMPPRNHTVAVSRLQSAATPAAVRLEEGKPAATATAPVHSQEAEQVRRIRSYKVELGGKTYRICRGDLHRHTDISNDGMGDGTLMDLHRYGMDAAALDFILVSDHNMGGDNEYSWWRTQKANELYTVPGRFISMYGYERSMPYPQGHRNVLWPQRGHRTLPLSRAGNAAQRAADTGRLYAYLRDTDGICTLHTSATSQGTNWNEPIDGRLEPIVELFQGYHGSYESPTAPRIVNAESDQIHGKFERDGYVSLALNKGIVLGFQASSDHISTHVSYACVLAESFTRQGLIEAMRQRHTYAATDNIVLDVRLGNQAMMGDSVRVAKPRLDVIVLGTGPIEKVEILRNGAVQHTETPHSGAAESRFSWEDPAPVAGAKPSYYYVRVMQKDRQMAWSSPIWVRGME